MHDAFTTWLSRTIAELGKLDQPPERDTMIGALGISSLAMLTLQFRLHSEHGVAVSLEDLSTNQSLGSLADQLAGDRQKENVE